MKKLGFAGGAAALGGAIALGKIFSAVFKIPLDRVFLHAEGMAVFNGAYNIYIFFFTLATAGLPLSLSKLVASSENRREEREYLSTASVFIGAALLAVSLVLFIFAPYIASFIKLPGCALSLRVMAPALLPLGVTAVLRGFFQGSVNLVPCALSQVSDAFGRLFLGFALAFFFMGSSIPALSAAAIGGVPFGALLSAFILMYFASRSGFSLSRSFSIKKLGEILNVAAPITLTASVYPFFNVIDTLTVLPLLSCPSPEEAFGCLTRASTLYALPVSLTSAVAAGILPDVAAALKNNNVSEMKSSAALALRLTLFIALPCAAGFFAVSDGIFSFLYDGENYSYLLVLSAPCAVFASLTGVFAAILQGFGDVSRSALTVLISLFIKLGLNIFLTPSLGVSAAAAASVFAYLFSAAALFVMIIRSTPIRFPFFNVFLKPIAAAALCGAAAALSARVLPFPIAVAIGGICYMTVIFATRFITFSELKSMKG